MAKHGQRWPIWKIAAATLGCGSLAAVLFWLSALADRPGGGQAADPSTRTPVLTLPAFIMMLAMMAAILSALGVVWLAFRIREARTPAWKRQGRKRRR
jgi:hypothetical protein